MRIGQKFWKLKDSIRNASLHTNLFFLLDICPRFLSTLVPWRPEGEDSGYCREWSGLLQAKPYVYKDRM